VGEARNTKRFLIEDMMGRVIFGDVNIIGRVIANGV
jgi:hypothetical protein